MGKVITLGTNIKLKSTDIALKLLDVAKKNKIKITKNNKIIFVKDRPGHDERYALNSNRIKEKLNGSIKYLSLKVYLKQLNGTQKIIIILSRFLKKI